MYLGSLCYACVILLAMVKVSFVIHGKIRRVSSFESLVRDEFRDGYVLHFLFTEKARHAEELSVEALDAGCDYLIAVGGDGTLSEVVNAFLRKGGNQVYSTRLGTLPWGTGNDFARSLSISNSLSALRSLIDSDSFRAIDAGEIRYQSADGQQQVRYFDNIADLGIGAEVVARVNGVNLRKIILGGTLVFFLTALQVFLTYRHKRVTVRAGSFSWTGKILSLVIANGQYFGSGLGVAPDARIDDGLFQLVLFGDLSVWDYLKNFGRLRRSQTLELPEVQYLVADEVHVEPHDPPLVAEADGEVVGEAPMQIRCLPGSLPFLMP